MEALLIILLFILVGVAIAMILRATAETKRRRKMHERIHGCIERNMKDDRDT